MSSLFNFFSIASVFGIWPRFIEPYRLSTTHLKWQQPCLEGLKILHFSDLHFGPHIPDHFLEKIVNKAMSYCPDIVLFSGDFLCFSKLDNPERLLRFLNRFQAPLGCYTVFGNHDYANYVSRTQEGSYTAGTGKKPISVLKFAYKAFISPPPKYALKDESVYSIGMHEELCQLLRQTPFQLLENTTVKIDGRLNLTGLGEFSLGRSRPETAYKGYDRSLPGIALIHNPDTIPLLKTSPGDWILAGHSHGEQIHFPYPQSLRKISRKMARLENPQYSRGLMIEKGKHLYTSRGVGSTFPFRLFSPPELLIIEAIS